MVYDIASELSQQVLKRRRDRDELSAPPLYVLNQRAEPCVFDAYAVDRPGIVDSFQGERKFFPVGKGK